MLTATRHFPLRTWTTTLSLLVLLPMLVVFGLGIVALEREQKRATLADLERHGASLAVAGEARLAATLATLNVLASSEAAQRGDLRVMHAHAQRVADLQGAGEAFALIDARSQVVFMTGQAFGAVTVPAVYPQLLTAVFERGAVNVSGPFALAPNIERQVAVTVPLRQNGVITHALRALVPVSAFYQLLAQEQLPEGWLASFIDRDGILVGRNVDPGRYVGARVSDLTQRMMAERRTVVFPARSLEGNPTTAMLVPIRGGEWFAGIAVPDVVLHAPARERMKEFFGFAIGWLALALVLSQTMAWFLGRQIDAVGDAVTQVAADGTVPRAAFGRMSLWVTEFRSLLGRYVESRQAEKAVRGDLVEVSSARDEATDLYDNAPCGYHSLDPDARVVRINQTELDWLGYRREEVLGRPFMDFLDDASKGVLRDHFPAFKASGTVANFEVALLRKDGTSLPVSLSATAVRDAAGTFVSSRTAVIDVTERKRIEAALFQANAVLQQQRELLEVQVQERTRKLAEALEVSEGADRAKTALLSNVSHELRTPLNQIAGQAFLLAREVSEPALRTRVDVITGASRRLLLLVSNLIDVARLESERLELAPGRCVLRNWAEALAAPVRQALVARDMALRIEIDAAVPDVVMADGLRLGQITRQLLDNAEKYSQRGTVTFRLLGAVQPDGRAALRIEVEDQGNGIPAAQRAQLFTLFRQGDGSSTRQHGGIGLGLALAQRLVHLMGGAIGVDAAPGGGSRFWFTVTVPRAPAEVAAAPVPGLSAAALTARVKELDALLADDDMSAQQLWRQSRAELAGVLQDDAAAFDEALETFDFAAALALLRARTGTAAAA